MKLQPVRSEKVHVFVQIYGDELPEDRDFLVRVCNGRRRHCDPDGVHWKGIHGSIRSGNLHVRCNERGKNRCRIEIKRRQPCAKEKGWKKLNRCNTPHLRRWVGANQYISVYFNRNEKAFAEITADGFVPMDLIKSGNGQNFWDNLE